ncbi:restriction endonuclease [Dolosicoccus paucivorans]|uniref:Restriction endonuclease n=1 Tax=Dolosicoccus paucivorans TaxID=84521 RepID=A0A2N6SKU2_9LACT|nr:restriction endonuclease [Dolosicoccus paucivorans]PMB83616.1 restriction endonuclease [Dolosicoccus paucivorans]PMC56706.1 restriction endonuclease [Dolosicoccus paucivorans]
MKEKQLTINQADVSEKQLLKEMPEIFDILLIDRTTSTTRKNKNIIWGNDEYAKYGERYYSSHCEMFKDLLFNNGQEIIKPRSVKSMEIQKERTKQNAEVFTPTWLVKKQNDEVDASYQSDDLETYVSRRWLEITCGEAPYIASRYDTITGEFLSLKDRVGFLDRKLRRINSEVEDKAEWQRLIEEAYKASYGFEWNGDSLLLARENLLYTYYDYYYDKWNDFPTYGLVKKIAEIISYNIFQMDGLKYIIPLSEKKEQLQQVQLSLFDDELPEEVWITHPGKRVKIMNWQKNRMEYFDEAVQ